MTAQTTAHHFAVIDLHILLLFLALAIIGIADCSLELSQLLGTDAIGHGRDWIRLTPPQPEHGCSYPERWLQSAGAAHEIGLGHGHKVTKVTQLHQ